MVSKRSIFILVLAGLVATGMVGAISTAHAQQESGVTHIVQPGENLYRIALRYGVDMNTLAEANNIVDQTRVFSGQTLIIPGLAAAVSSDVVENPLVAGTPTLHVVQAGESLSIIAQRYGLTVEQLMQSNNIGNANRIFRGQELTVWTTESVAAPVEAAPEANTASVEPGAAATTGTSYVVQRGEHLSQIAQRYGLHWTTLAQYNGLASPDTLFAGQTISIPALNSDGGVADMGIVSPVLANNGPGATIQTGRQIVVDLSDSRIYAYEDGQLINSVIVSTGLPATPTVVGDFTIYHRLPSQTMSGPGYYLPGVQHVQYFYQGYAIHGTYWHNNFGQPMSHGCVNLTNADAEWFYNFADYGTPVHVRY